MPTGEEKYSALINARALFLSVYKATSGMGSNKQITGRSFMIFVLSGQFKKSDYKVKKQYSYKLASVYYFVKRQVSLKFYKHIIVNS